MTVALPVVVPLLTAALCLFAGSAKAQESKVVVLGDSNTQGVGVNPQDAFPSRVETILRSSGRSVRVLNAGVAGDTSEACWRVSIPVCRLIHRSLWCKRATTT
jgi:lysophospholipase L1-like esterase